MRIIAGEFRSRKLFTPPDAEITRPIPDRVKESLFGLLRGHIEGSEVFDGFAGTGAIGLEALSRGARRVVLVEQNRQIARILKQNIDLLNVADRTDLVQSDVLGMGAISRCPREARVIFLDPPYPLAEDPLGWRRITSAMQELAKNLTPDGFIIVRTPWPFFEAEPEPDASQPAHKPKGKWKKEDKDRWNKSAWQDEPRTDSRRSPRDKKANPSKLLTGSARDHDPFGEDWEEIDPLDAQGLTEAMIEETETPESASPDAAPKPPRKHAELKIPGLKGPETHIYRHTAVHFYMRQ